MNKYEIKFYKNNEEIDISELPDEYLNGVIQSCRGEVTNRERLNRVGKGLAKFFVAGQQN